MDTSWFFRASPIDQRVSRFYHELLQEVQKTGDNAQDVLGVLEKHGFDHLSQETQLYVLCGNIWPAWLGSVYQKVIRANKINTMIALLQCTPLFAIAKDSIPQHKWIESPTWMQNMLYENKVRWKPGRCQCRNHSDPCNDEEKLCALTKIALTMFAADLVSTRDTLLHDNEHCLLYILNVAPDLLKIRVPSYCNETSLRWVILKLIHNPDMLDILMMKESYLHDNTGEILTFLLRTVYTSSNSDTHFFIQNRSFLITTVARGHEEKIKHYRDFSGSSLLHIVCQYMWDPSLLYWINELLRIGLNPSERNNKYKTALDVLITSFCEESHSVIIQHEKDIDDSQFLARSFCQAVNMFVPYFKDTSVSQMKINKIHNTRYPSVEGINDDFINLYCKILDKGVFPSFTESNMFTVHVNMSIHGCKKRNSTSCKLCKPLVDIMWQALHKGLNLSDDIFICECGKNLTLTGQTVRLLELSRDQPCRCNTTDPAVQLTKCGCCGWQLLELMIHCYPYITGDSKCGSGNGCDICYKYDMLLMHVLSKKNYRRPLTLFDISCITKLIWMYFPADKIPITDYLHTLQDDTSDTDESKVVSDLQDMIQTVQPLTLLCRLCILQNVQWKDIKHLPAPVGLIRYLELGDISDDHIIHEVL